MTVLTKDQLLAASDIREREIELPSIGGSVRVRSLSAAYSNQAMSDAIEMTNVRGEQVAKFSTTRLEELKLLHGLVDPKLDTVEEARQFSENVGSAWRMIIDGIDELSGITQQSISQTNATFRVGGSGQAGSPAGNGVAAGGDGPDLSMRAGARIEDADR